MEANEEKELEPAQSIEIIQQMINKTKSNFSKDYSFYYLFWGWLILAATVLHFFLLRTSLSALSYLPWPILCIAGSIVSSIYAIKSRKKEKSETYLGNFMQVFFTTGWLLYFVGVFICVSNNISPNPLVLLISGFYGIVSGRLLKFMPFVYGGVLFIMLAIFSNYVSLSTQLLLIAAGVITGYLVPGYLLRSKSAV